MSDFDFRFVFRDRLAVLADAADERTPAACADLELVGEFSPPEALSACKGLVVALAHLHKGAATGDVLCAPGCGEALDPATMLQGAAFLDSLRADAWNAADWEVYALAFHLQDALERRVRPADHELVEFGGEG